MRPLKLTVASFGPYAGVQELDIVDLINTTERSVNTLSGGEAFLASLALALGLSAGAAMTSWLCALRFTPRLRRLLFRGLN